MITATITLTDNASPAVARVNAFLSSDGARQLVGYSGTAIVKEHFDDLEQSHPNKQGFPRLHYWSDARKATRYYLDGSDVVIAVNGSEVPGIKLHFYGGTVEAGRNTSFVSGEPTKYLTIPACGESYGKRASEFEELMLVYGLGGQPYALALPVAKESMDRFGAVKVSVTPGKIMYWLKESVMLQPDPTVLPPMQEIASGIADQMGKAVKRRFQGDVSVEVTAEVEGEP
jgi:hypothetical protein